MTTRAASVANSQRAKQHVVNLLFKSDYSRKGRDAHRKLDFASYSYADLRDAYLKRIQAIHPDKVAHNIDVGADLGVDDNIDVSIDVSADADVERVECASTSTSTSTQHTMNDISSNYWTEDKNNGNWKEVKTKIDLMTSKKSKSKNSHESFIELQDAWDKYEKLVRAMQRGRKDSEIRGVQEDFTLFGVGCSFSDSVEESQQRAQIMDQAGKGWFAAGTLSEALHDHGHNEEKTDEELEDEESKSTKVSLLDDELFSDIPVSLEANGITKSRKSLIDHLLPQRKRSHKRQHEQDIKE
jgi:hypothetical protein